MANEPEHFTRRYRRRPATFNAYVEVWRRPAVKERFADWDAFSRAANAERTQRDEDVLDAERLMHDAGFEEGPQDEVGARQWQRVFPT